MGGPDKEGGAFDGAGLIPHQVIPCQIIPGGDDTLSYLSDFVLFSLFVDNVEFEFRFSVITIVLSSHPFILKFGMGKFLGVWNPEIRLRRLKNNPVLSYLRF